MATRLDTLSPLYMGEDKITIAVNPISKPPTAERPVTLDFDLSRANAAGGLVLPVKLIIQPPSLEGVGYIEKVFSRLVPSSYTFVPREAGEHFILLRESGHNLWQGRLLIQVEGEQFSRVLLNERV